MGKHEAPETNSAAAREARRAWTMEYTTRGALKNPPQAFSLWRGRH